MDAAKKLRDLVRKKPEKKSTPSNYTNYLAKWYKLDGKWIVHVQGSVLEGDLLIVKRHDGLRTAVKVTEIVQRDHDKREVYCKVVNV